MSSRPLLRGEKKLCRSVGQFEDEKKRLGQNGSHMRNGAGSRWNCSKHVEMGAETSKSPKLRVKTPLGGHFLEETTLYGGFLLYFGWGLWFLLAPECILRI